MNIETLDNITDLSINKDQSVLAVSYDNGEISFFDLRSKNELNTMKVHEDRVNGIVFDNSKRFFYSISND